MVVKEDAFLTDCWSFFFTAPFAWLISSTFLSEQTSRQQSTSSTFLSEKSVPATRRELNEHVGGFQAKRAHWLVHCDQEGRN
jgi:hypothetical protein